MKRAPRLVVGLIMSVGFGAVAAHAAVLPVSTARVGTGDGAVSGCDPDGVSVAYTDVFDTSAADYRTTSVTVSGIAGSCAGRSLAITIRADTGAALWQGTTTVTSASASLSVPSLPSASIAGWAATLTG